MSKSGTCLCGAVGYRIDAEPTEIAACHCNMCRKWSGGVFLALEAAADTVSFSGAGNIGSYASSDWAERAFCKTCGSSLYYRVTAPGPQQGVFYFGFGTLDDPGEIALSHEIFIDAKPAGYSFAEATHKMTSTDFMAMFTDSDDR